MKTMWICFSVSLLGVAICMLAITLQLSSIRSNIIELERRTYEIMREAREARPYIRHIHRAVCPTADHDLDEEEPR